jgi:signal transduction histidine kinase/DNA-binding response OmpR family regulator
MASQLFISRKELEEEKSLAEVKNRQLNRKFRVLEKQYQEILEDNHQGYQIIQEQQANYSKQLKSEIQRQTAELRFANEQLHKEIHERKRSEEALRKAKADTEAANWKLLKVNVDLEQAMTRANEMAQKAEIANKAKSTFLANMSHEIRTPMNGVIGFTDLLLETGLNEQQLEYTQTIKRSGEALLTLINDILDFSKIEAGELDFEEIEFDPEMIVNDACELIAPEAQSKSIEILCRIQNDLPDSLLGDPTRFRQVLSNLMSNASKFTTDGEIELSLGIEKESSSAILLHTTVRDTGIGISKEKLALIFNPFQQADGSTTRKFGGSGLGLSICRQIARSLKGDVWVESQPGGGSIFHFSGWFNKTADSRPFEPPRSVLSGKNVLVVDTNANALRIMRSILTYAGMHVTGMTGDHKFDAKLEQALKTQNTYDVCFIDMQLPEDRSHKIIAQLGESDKAPHICLKIGMIKLMDKTARDYQTKGVDMILTKPIRRSKLLKLLQKQLAHHKKPSQADNENRGGVDQVAQAPQLKTARILLAEDNPLNQKLAVLMLNKAGYEVEVAGNGLEAIEKLTADPQAFDLIIMDVQMPEMDGIESTKEIRCKGFNSVPIVAMTAHAMREDKEKCLAAGMNDYISKPINKAKINNMLQKFGLKSGTD